MSQAEAAPAAPAARVPRGGLLRSETRLVFRRRRVERGEQRRTAAQQELERALQELNGLVRGGVAGAASAESKGDGNGSEPATATATMRPACPVNTCSPILRSRSHTLTVVSKDPETARRPSGVAPTASPRATWVVTE